MNKSSGDGLFAEAAPCEVSLEEGFVHGQSGFSLFFDVARPVHRPFK
jgi:hypothetical protein